MGKPILCLDFDGVIHSYTSGWKGADVISDPMVERTEEFLKEAVEKFEVHIFSSRSHQTGGIEAMKEYIHYGLIEKYRKVEADCIIYLLKFPLEKPPAFLTIDDRAIQFTGVWPDINELLTFKPWNKK